MKLPPVMAAMVLMGSVASVHGDTVLFDNGAANSTSTNATPADSLGQFPWSMAGDVFTPTIGGTVQQINFAGEYEENDTDIDLTESFTISLYSTVSGAPTTSSLIATSILSHQRTDTGSVLGDGNELYGFSGTLDSPLTVTLGKDYYLGITDNITQRTGVIGAQGAGNFYVEGTASPGPASSQYLLSMNEDGLGAVHFVGPSDVSLAFTLSGIAAPEPSTWALMLGGLGALAFWRLRTRRRA